MGKPALPHLEKAVSAIGALHVALYVRVLISDGETPVALPALQKMAAILLVLWRVACSIAVMHSGPRS